jgi:hypothetical protein
VAALRRESPIKPGRSLSILKGDLPRSSRARFLAHDDGRKVTKNYTAMVAPQQMGPSSGNSDVIGTYERH